MSSSPKGGTGHAQIILLPLACMAHHPDLFQLLSFSHALHQIDAAGDLDKSSADRTVLPPLCV